ncbi:MAG: hypothetical protein Q9167_003883 [Letrouitia subvulpina]
MKGMNQGGTFCLLDSLLRSAQVQTAHADKLLAREGPWSRPAVWLLKEALNLSKSLDYLTIPDYAVTSGNKVFLWIEAETSLAVETAKDGESTMQDRIIDKERRVAGPSTIHHHLGSPSIKHWAPARTASASPG